MKKYEIRILNKFYFFRIFILIAIFPLLNCLQFKENSLDPNSIESVFSGLLRISSASSRGASTDSGESSDPPLCKPENWTLQSASENVTWDSVTYGNGLFVAVSRDAPVLRVMTSSNGIDWAGRNTPTTMWRSVTFGNGQFAAVAMGACAPNCAMTSPDGINWTPQSASPSNSWTSITYGNGKFVAVANFGTDPNIVLTSNDGITWNASNAAQTNQWYGVTFGNGLFVAVSTNGSTQVHDFD